MTDSTPPLVLIEIDRNSRLHVLQHRDVRVGVVDRRVDPVVHFLPPVDQQDQIDAMLGSTPFTTAKRQDAAHSADEATKRLDEGRIVVAELVR